MTTFQVILGEQTDFYYMLRKAKMLLSCSHGIVPDWNIYSNVAIKRRSQVNTEAAKLLPDI